MQFRDLSLVSVDEIPDPPYETPSHDLPLMYSVAKRMEVLCSKHGGIGLSAAQAGIPWRMFVFLQGYPEDVSSFGCYFDCEYRPNSDSRSRSVEGCLSLPGMNFSVERYDEVEVSGMRLFAGDEGPSAEPFSAKYSGVMSVLMQHEIDHDLGRTRMIDIIGKRVYLA